MGVEGAAPRFYMDASGDVAFAASSGGQTRSIEVQVRRSEPNRDGRLIIPGSDLSICRMQLRVTFTEEARSSS